MFSPLWPHCDLLSLRVQSLLIHINWCVCLLPLSPPPPRPGCLLYEDKDFVSFGQCYLSSTPGTKCSLTDWLTEYMNGNFYARGNQGWVRWHLLPQLPLAHSGAGFRRQSNSIVSAHDTLAPCDLFSISIIMLFHRCYMCGIMKYISYRLAVFHSTSFPWCSFKLFIFFF